MSRRVVACSRCEKQLYAYPSEAGPFYCETVRCESTEPQRQEKNGPDPRQEIPGPLNSKDTQEGASIMTDDTGTPTNSGTAPVKEWHPWWCARGEMCTPKKRDGDIHYSPPRRLVADLPSEGPDGGESFTAGVSAVALTEWGEVFDQCAVLSIENRCGVGDIELHLGVNTMRDLADWLMQMADMIEQVHAGQRTDLAELEGAISNG